MSDKFDVHGKLNADTDLKSGAAPSAPLLLKKLGNS
jgi:hypothetical protein